MKKALIAILNFNGSCDTIECIKSFYKYENKENYTIVIMDNGSNENDWTILEKYILGMLSIEKKILDFDYYIRCDITKYDLVLVKNNENLGFAAGNNAIVKSHKDKFKYVVLLNNDTELVSSSTDAMLSYLDMHNNVKVVSTSIYYYRSPSNIWSAGGKAFWGTRKYYTEEYVNKLLLDGINVLRVDFITGCYFAIRSADIESTGIFTEKFFHGEEDYNFAMNQKKQNAVFDVLLSERLLHKVGATSDRDIDIDNIVGKCMPHHLNRFIDMKDFYGNFQWNAWRWISSLYIFLLIYKKTRSLQLAYKYVCDLNYLSQVMNGINREEFFMLRNHKIEELKQKYK